MLKGLTGKDLFMEKSTNIIGARFSPWITAAALSFLYPDSDAIHQHQ